MNQDKKQEFIDIYTSKIHRTGSEELLEYLKKQEEVLLRNQLALQMELGLLVCQRVKVQDGITMSFTNILKIKASHRHNPVGARAAEQGRALIHRLINNA